MKDSDWRILYELHRNPNITRAAGVLYKTQSAITKRLQYMEEEFGVRIVDRLPHGLEFTREGEFLAGQAEKYLRLDMETKSGLKLLRESVKENIVIGSAYTYTKYSLPAVLDGFSKDHPNATYRVINKQSDLLYQMLREGQLDVAFIRSDFYEGVYHDLLDYTAAYCVTRDPVDLQKLPEMTSIGYQTNDKTRALIADWWRDYFGTEKPDDDIDAGYIEFAFPHVARGDAYLLCFLPDNFVNQYNLVLTPLRHSDGTELKRRTWFIYPKDKKKRAIVEDFIRYIEENVMLH